MTALLEDSVYPNFYDLFLLIRLKELDFERELGCGGRSSVAYAQQLALCL